MPTSSYMPDVEVMVAFNAGYGTGDLSRVWTDVSDYVELSDRIRIAFGRQDELSTAGANTLNLTLDNSDGRFTAGRAASPYYPNVKIGRPIRVIATPEGSPELVTNTGAEVNVTGWSGFGGSAVARSTAQAYEGTASFLCTWPTAGAGGSTIFSTVTGLTIGKLYRFAARVRVPAGQPRMQLKASAAVSEPSSTNNEWQRLSVTFRATATSHDVEVKHADAATAGQTGYFDAATAKLTSFRYTGFIDEWPVEWEGTDAYATAKIKASSRLARLGLSAKLRSGIEQAVRGVKPWGYWMLGDASGSTQAADSSGNGRAPLDVVGSGAAIVFGNAIGPGSDGLTAAEFAAGQYLYAPIADGTAPRALRITAQVNALPALNATLIEVGTALGPFRIYVTTAGVVTASRMGGAFSPIIGPTVPTNPITGPTLSADGSVHDIVFVFSTTAATLFVDGVSVGTNAGYTQASQLIAGLNVGVAFTGVLSHAALLDTVSTAVVLADAQNMATAVASGYAGDRTDQRFTRLLGWAGVPASETSTDTGVETMTYQETSGQTVVDALREVESTEGGVMFDGQDGRVTFHGRARRYLATAAATLNMAAQHVGADFSPKLDRSTLANDVEVSNPTTGEKARAASEASSDEYGIATASAASVSSTYDSLQQKAAWLVASYAEPRNRVPSLTVDVLAHAGPVNLIPNPSFEVDTTGWSSGNGTFSRVADGGAGVAGSWCGGFVSTAVASQFATHAVVPATPGQEYTGSVYLKMQGVASNYNMQILWFSGATFLSASTVVYPSGSLSGGSFTRMEITDTAPATADRVRIQAAPVTNLAIGAGFRIDGASLIRSDVSLPYFDGDTPGSGWSGTAHASPSDMVAPSAQTLLDLTVGDLLAVTNAPTQSDTTSQSYFVEGYTESIGPEFYEISFNLSPTYPTLSTFVIGDATRGQLDSTYVLAL